MISHHQHFKFNKGFILLPVVFTLTILAAVAYLLSREGAMNAGNVNREQQQDLALYIAQAGYNHAVWQLNRQNCTGYADIPDTALGENSYFAEFTDTTGTTLTAGSPANIKVTGIHAMGAIYTINRNREKIYQFPTQQLIFQPGAASGKDAYLWYPGTTDNYGSVKETWVSTKSNDRTVALYQFDLRSVPSGVKILSATLSLYHWEGWNSDVPISAHRITNSWNETEVSWDNRTSTQPWDTPAGDFDPEVIDTTLVGPASKIRYEWQLKSVVEKWVNGSHPNYGVLLRTTAPNIVGERFYTSDDDDEDRHPRLTITYACECGKTCIIAKKIYWTDDNAEKIQSSDEDGSNVETIISGQYKARGLDIDTVNGKIYWTSDDYIRRSNLDGGNNETIFTAGTELNFDIKLDVAGGKMYWTYDNLDNEVMRANLDGSNIETLNASTDRPMYFSLDVTNGFIYVTEYGNNSISRMNLDGSSVTPVVAGSGSGNIGSAIDTVNGKIYWTGGSTNKWIKRANLDGTNEEPILSSQNSPQDITYDADNNRIYWTDAVDKVIRRANADGSNIETIVSTGLTRPRGIILVNAEDVNSSPSFCDGTFRDEFNNRVYSGNDGTLNWIGDWLEINESDGPLDNDERVFEDTYEDPPMPTYQLHVRDSDGGGEGVMRALNLSGANTATLSFDYKPYGLDKSSDYVSVQMSTTGTAGSWTEVVRFAGPATETAYQFYSTDISDYISSDSALRIITSSKMGEFDYLWFDNIQIECKP